MALWGLFPFFFHWVVTQLTWEIHDFNDESGILVMNNLLKQQIPTEMSHDINRYSTAMDINFSKSQGSDSSLRDGSWAAFQELAAKTPHQLLSCPKMVHSQAKHLQVWVKKTMVEKKQFRIH